MKAIKLTLFFALALFMSCAQKTIDKQILFPEGPFLGIKANESPDLLYPGFISTRLGEYNGTFNPEGTVFFYTTSIVEYDVIVYTQMQKDKSWSLPEIVPFSAPYHEFDPVFSPDGNRLYFSSHRPASNDSSSEASNIWYVEREGESWSPPQFVALAGPKRGNYHSSLTLSGNIYFNIWNTGNMYQAMKTEDGYRVASLGNVVNAEQGDGDPFVAPDESYLIFRSYRPGGKGSGDLWISFKIDGLWQEPQNLGEPINSKYNEMCPYVTTDQKLFIFSSGRMEKTYYDENINDLNEIKEKLDSYDNGHQNIYTMSAQFIIEMRNDVDAQRKK